MFSQVDRSIERTTGGLGIGLALVRGIVEAHAGKILAASEGLGKGSTFTVMLPVSGQLDASASDPSIKGQETAINPRNILVVDDNRDSAESMAAMLRLLGNIVQVAHDGLEAIAVADKWRPDIILMDIGMPKLNGYEATKRIRSQPWGKSIVIVAVTGWGQDEDRERSRDAQCDYHLVKPVKPADLTKLLNELTPR
jgi:CheY-like chemotaxis protein